MEENLLKLRNKIASTDPNLYMAEIEQLRSHILFTGLYSKKNCVEFRKLLKKSLRLLHPNLDFRFSWRYLEQKLSQQQIVALLDMVLEHYRLRVFE